MRAPGQLWSEIGPASFWTVQILFAGLILSALAHPLMLGTLGWLAYNLSNGFALGAVHSVIFIIDAVNITLSYFAFLLLGWRTLDRPDRKQFWKVVVFMPVYWMAMSVAATRAIVQLVRKPHHWDKTPHFRTAASSRS